MDVHNLYLKTGKRSLREYLHTEVRTFETLYHPKFHYLLFKFLYSNTFSVFKIFLGVTYFCLSTFPKIIITWKIVIKQQWHLIYFKSLLVSLTGKFIYAWILKIYLPLSCTFKNVAYETSYFILFWRVIISFEFCGLFCVEFTVLITRRNDWKYFEKCIHYLCFINFTNEINFLLIYTILQC